MAQQERTYTARRWWGGVALAGLMALAGCATGPTHPSLADAQLPELIPVRNFVASLEATGDENPHIRPVAADQSGAAWVGGACQGSCRLSQERRAEYVESGQSS